MTADPFHQTAPDPPYAPDVNAFADDLEAVMSDGTHDLAGIAAALSARRTVAGGHRSWTPETLSVFLAGLAKA